MSAAEPVSRPSWQQTWMATAVTIGGRSRCTRAKVGAVIVTADNRVNSSSYNGPPPGFYAVGNCGVWCPRARAAATDAIQKDYSDCPANHAEANAIARADFTQIRGGTIYVSSAVCFTCAKLIASSGISAVAHIVHDTDWHRQPVAVERFLRECGILVLRANETVNE